MFWKAVHEISAPQSYHCLSDEVIWVYAAVVFWMFFWMCVLSEHTLLFFFLFLFFFFTVSHSTNNQAVWCLPFSSSYSFCPNSPLCLCFLILLQNVLQFIMRHLNPPYCIKLSPLSYLSVPQESTILFSHLYSFSHLFLPSTIRLYPSFTVLSGTLL